MWGGGVNVIRNRSMIAPFVPIARTPNLVGVASTIKKWWIGLHNTNPRDGADPANRQERCLGPGHHTGYFTDERWRRVARHVVTTPCPASLADVDLGDLTVAMLDGPPGPPPDDPTPEVPGPAVY